MATATAPPPMPPQPAASTLLAINTILPRYPPTTTSNTHSSSSNNNNNDTPPLPPPTYNFSFTPFLRAHGLASLISTVPVCATYSSTGSCPLGRHCPNRHPTPNHQLGNNSNTNNNNNNNVSGLGATGGATGAGAGAGPHFSRQNDNYVCKHWLKGLCKKGDACDYLHEYNLRKMSECQFYNSNGYCQNGDECLYVHVKEDSKLPLCEAYHRGFCERGPRCGKRHVRRKLCLFYMAGFCPDGPECRFGVHLKAPVGGAGGTGAGGAGVGHASIVLDASASLNDEDKMRKDRLAEMDRRGDDGNKDFGWKAKKGRGGGGRWKDKRDRR